MQKCTCARLFRCAPRRTLSNSARLDDNRFDLGEIAPSSNFEQISFAFKPKTKPVPAKAPASAITKQRASHAHPTHAHRSTRHPSSTRPDALKKYAKFPAIAAASSSKHVLNTTVKGKGKSKEASAIPPKQPDHSLELPQEPSVGYAIDTDPPFEDFKSKRNDRERHLRSPKGTAPQSSKATFSKDRQPSRSNTPAQLKSKNRKLKTIKANRDLIVPSLISVNNLALLLKVKLGAVQYAMKNLGMENTQSSRLLTADDSAIVAMSFNYNAVIDDEKAFDVYPDPPSEDASKLLPRPPIVAIMGHVDHGKTTLLDKLRSASVAQGEAGGITQHIGAFEVPRAALTGAQPTDLDSSIQSITFLDTPGHAAFKNMRSRGKGVTDIVVLVVAADDGVMAQTKEVIDLVLAENTGASQKESVGVVVAITKCDKPGVDIHRVKQGLGAAGLIVEDMGGEIPCVEVSALSGEGLDDLVETLTVVAEVRDLKAERADVRSEGRIIESRVEKGRGNVATVLVLRGTLNITDTLVAGQAKCKVRQLVSSSGLALKSALPGQPVEVIGWKDLPQAGDEVLTTANEEESRKVIEARLRRKEQADILTDVEAINTKRLAEAQEAARQAAIAEKAQGKKQHIEKPVVEKKGPKELLLIVKADVSGSEEAVVQSLDGIGNNLAVAKVISSGVGDVSESDVTRAQAVGATIIGFNVKCPKSLQVKANSVGLRVLMEPIIYRLIEQVTADVTALLPELIESRIIGEATIMKVFDITIKGRITRPVAGCRIGNGIVNRNGKIRIVRAKKIIYQGTLESLKHVKTDIESAAKGSECGMAFEGFDQFQEGDAILCYEEYTVKRHL